MNGMARMKNDGFWAGFMQAARETPSLYFAPLTWGIAWLKGVLTGHSASAPDFRDWIHGLRHVTPTGGNVFLDLGFSKQEAARLQLNSYRRMVCHLQDKLESPYAFILDEQQIAMFEAWKKDQNRKVIEMQKASLKNFDDLTLSGTQPYYGACGGGYTFHFSRSGIGVFVIASNSITNEELNLTHDL